MRTEQVCLCQQALRFRQPSLHLCQCLGTIHLRSPLALSFSHQAGRQPQTEGHTLRVRLLHFAAILPPPSSLANPLQQQPSRLLLLHLRSLRPARHQSHRILHHRSHRSSIHEPTQSSHKERWRSGKIFRVPSLLCLAWNGQTPLRRRCET